MNQSLFNRNPSEIPLQTNKWIANSLQDALNRYSPPNSRGVYHSQDGEYEYEIYTDFNGIKSYETYKRTLCEKEDPNQPITQEDLKKVLEQIKLIQEKINESSTNASNGFAEMQRPENGINNSK